MMCLFSIVRIPKGLTGFVCIEGRPGTRISGPVAGGTGRKSRAIPIPGGLIVIVRRSWPHFADTRRLPLFEFFPAPCPLTKTRAECCLLRHFCIVEASDAVAYRWPATPRCPISQFLRPWRMQAGQSQVKSIYLIPKNHSSSCCRPPYPLRRPSRRAWRPTPPHRPPRHRRPMPL